MCLCVRVVCVFVYVCICLCVCTCCVCVYVCSVCVYRWVSVTQVGYACVYVSLPLSLTPSPLYVPHSDPYVKASLICDGRRLKKRKSSMKKNTLNPVYNEALVFDIPNENMEHVNVIIAVMDYDCIGHNEVIGMCRVGNDCDGPGREHWNEMLGNPRKPIEQWHQLVE
uniref:Synaptotagmin-C-like n=1 Tax=Callorhinchus milii TaxID=7868 RepID=A0A4W3GBG3_CALMI